MWVCDKRVGGDGEVYLIESEEGYQEMSVRLQVAVMLDFACRDERVEGMLEKMCMEAEICDCLSCYICNSACIILHKDLLLTLNRYIYDLL